MGEWVGGWGGEWVGGWWMGWWRGTLLDLCVSSLRRGRANLLCIVPILADAPERSQDGLVDGLVWWVGGWVVSGGWMKVGLVVGGGWLVGRLIGWLVGGLVGW